MLFFLCFKCVHRFLGMNSSVTKTILLHSFKCQAHTVSAVPRARHRGWKSVIISVIKEWEIPDSKCWQTEVFRTHVGSIFIAFHNSLTYSLNYNCLHSSAKALLRHVTLSYCEKYPINIYLTSNIHQFRFNIKRTMVQLNSSFQFWIWIRNRFTFLQRKISNFTEMFSFQKEASDAPAFLLWNHLRKQKQWYL